MLCDRVLWGGMNQIPEITERLEYMFGMSFLDLFYKLNTLTIDVYEKQQLLELSHPEWLVTDHRISCLSDLMGIASHTTIYLTSLLEMTYIGWWIARSNEDMPLVHKYHTTISVANSIKYKFGMDYFISLEATFRAILRALDPDACENSTKDYQSIYMCLLGNHQLCFETDEKKQAIQTLEFIRKIRNLIHNGSVYYNKDRVDKIIKYKDREYRLSYGQPVDWITWSMLFDLADDIVGLLFRVVNDPKVIEIEAIPDPIMTTLVFTSNVPLWTPPTPY